MEENIIIIIMTMEKKKYIMAAANDDYDVSKHQKLEIERTQSKQNSIILSPALAATGMQ